MTVEACSIPSPPKVQTLFRPTPQEVSYKNRRFYYSGGAILTTLAAAILVAAFVLSNPFFIGIGIVFLIGAGYAFFKGKKAVISSPTLAKITLATNYINQFKEAPICYTKQELVEFVGRNREGYLRHFSSYKKTIPYRYRIEGILEVKGEPYPEAVFRTCVKQALGLEENQDPVERLRECITSSDLDLQKKALHISAFLKMIGDGNCNIPDDPRFNLGLVEQAMLMDVNPVNPAEQVRAIPLVPPQAVGSSPLGYQVVNQEAPLYLTDDYMQATMKDRKAVAAAIYRTSRTVLVNVPDEKGDVNCIITQRKYTKVPQLGEG